ncbi:MAG: signal peptidase II [Nitrospinae bacterium]|nr:signal peptidase II [Nitrospinota bacterium]MCZ6512433.1 signal peptidase II [Nitrospinota bacterium]
MSNRYLYLFLASNVLIILDQYTKLLVSTHIPQGHFKMVIDGFFAITHIRNPGVAFGLFAEGPSQFKTLLFVGFSLIAIIAILIFFHQTPRERKMVQVALILIFSGAIGNLIDRILYHEVIDFIDLFVGRYHWPAFNIADSCITVGVVLMFTDLIRSGKVPQINSSSDTPEST